MCLADEKLIYKYCSTDINALYKIYVQPIVIS